MSARCAAEGNLKSAEACLCRCTCALVCAACAVLDLHPASAAWRTPSTRPPPDTRCASHCLVGLSLHLTPAGKLAIFIFAAWAGLEAGGVITGLAVCGVVFASVSSASDLMQDFRTG